MLSYCPSCGKPVYFGEKKRSLGKDYHPLCLKCYRCKRQLSPGQHADHDEKPYCSHCYLQYFGPRDSLQNLFPQFCGQYNLGGPRRPASRTTSGAAASSVPVENPST